MSLDDHHLHILARFRDRKPRKRMGWANFYATKAVKRFIELEKEKTHGSAVGFDVNLNLAKDGGPSAGRKRRSPIGNIS